MFDDYPWGYFKDCNLCYNTSLTGEIMTQTNEYESLIGKTVEDAEQISGKIIRVVAEDGQRYVLTMEFRMDRLNVELVEGLISAVKGIG